MKRTFPFLAMCLAISGTALFVLKAEMGSSNTNLSAPDREFLQKAALTGLTEVELGRLAMKKGVNAEVKILGERMVMDHEAINSDLSGLAKKKGVELPIALDEKGRARVEMMDKMAGSDFDQIYLDHTRSMHERDMEDFGKARFSTTDNDLKAVLSRILPVIKNYQGNLQEIPNVSSN